MPTWQDQRQRFQGYTRPWSIIVMGCGFLFQTRPSWLGGSSTRPENMSRRDYVSGQLFQALSRPFKAYEASSTFVPSLVASAHGIVLEVGPGTGAQLDHFDASKISHIYGVEFNPAFVSPLLAEVQKAGLQGKYTVILGSVDDEALLAEHGLSVGSVDSVVCIGTLCSVEEPAKTVKGLCRLLRPGGSFIFWEHRRSCDFLTRLVQEVWNPVWRYFMGGCELNRSIGDVIREAGPWESPDPGIWAAKGLAEEWSIMPRVEGRPIKSVETQ